MRQMAREQQQVNAIGGQPDDVANVANVATCLKSPPCLQDFHVHEVDLDGVSTREWQL